MAPPYLYLIYSSNSECLLERAKPTSHKKHIILRNVLPFFLLETFYQLSCFLIRQSHGLRNSEFGYLQNALNGCLQAYLVPHRNKNRIFWICSHSQASSPLSPWLSYQYTELPLFLYFLFTLFLHFILIQSIDVKEGLPHAQGGSIQNDPKMATQSALVRVQYPISVNDDQIWPKLVFPLLEPLEKLV